MAAPWATDRRAAGAVDSALTQSGYALQSHSVLWSWAEEGGCVEVFTQTAESSLGSVSPALTLAGASQWAYTLLYSNMYQEAVMQPLRLDEDIRQLSEFRAGVAGFVRRVSETRRPLLLTQHGRGVAVLVDVREFEAMRERLALLEDVSAAEADVAAGRLTAHEEAKAHVLEDLAT